MDLLCDRDWEAMSTTGFAYAFFMQGNDDTCRSHCAKL
ncbi:hypothetical protein COO91_02554 [Nostoc flagelliforme CCNUN1]|uniref:Uncharacterized protein n=1 Tax=Nostoc flagelliforme CCNUN1 TaxID=2038116 RepID=A0A2K8SMV1_9NOSO|nr:hypothetical protein COO91_02554 [Nostoc flagelliforme CCNUN1]